MNSENTSLAKVPEKEPSVLAEYNSEQMSVIKGQIAKNATDNELILFLTIAKKHELDPFAKEIWCVKYGNNPAAIMTSRDGYLKIAMRDPNFEGIASGAIRKGDQFKVDYSAGTVDHVPDLEAMGKRDNLVGAWAICYHRTRRPVVFVAPFAEYAKQNDIWKNYPSAMIQKVAEVFVLKRQFSINGLVTVEEIWDESAAAAPTAPVRAAPVAKALPPMRAPVTPTVPETPAQEAQIEETGESEPESLPEAPAIPAEAEPVPSSAPATMAKPVPITVQQKRQIGLLFSRFGYSPEQEPEEKRVLRDRFGFSELDELSKTKASAIIAHLTEELVRAGKDPTGPATPAVETTPIQ